MPASSLLVPPALLAAAVLLGWGLGAAEIRVGRWPAAAGAWLSLAAMLAIWFGSGRTILELNLPGSLSGAPLSLRLGPIAVTFGLCVLLAAALLLTFQERSWSEAALGALATCASLLATESGSVLLTALMVGTCASLVLLALLREQARATPGYWFALTAAGLLLLWAATVLDVTGGTSVYSAAPVTALRVPVFTLLAAAGLLCSGLLPIRTWVSEVWRRPRLQAGTLAVALVVPLGLLLLVRAYELGAGHWPASWLNPVLAAEGVAVALGAALRAQAARTRRGFLSEAVPLSAGMTLLSLSLGTPFSVSAATVGLVGSALLAGLLPVLPPTRRPIAVLGIAIAAGMPPAVIFAGRLLAIQAAIEVGGLLGFLGLAAAAAWLLGLAAAARALRLPDREDWVGDRVGSQTALVIAVLGGVGVGALEALLATPMASEAIPATASSVSGGYLAVVTPAGGWPAVTLAGPLLALAAAAVLLYRVLSRRWPGLTLVGGPSTQPPPPLLRLRSPAVAERLAAAVASVRLPAEYRSLFRPQAIEAAMAASRPWLWAATTAALVLAVTR